MAERFKVSNTVIIVRRREQENKYLMIKRSPDSPVYPNTWSVPGGKVDASDFLREPDTTEGHHYAVLEAAAARELSEEVHYFANPEELHYLCSLAYNNGAGIIVSFWMLDNGEGEPQCGDGVIEFAWMTLDEIKPLVTPMGLKEEIEWVDRLVPPTNPKWVFKYR